MKPTKGIYSDNRPSEQPEGTYPYAKNGIQYDLHGSVLNEPGFRKLIASVPYSYNGIIPTDGRPVVFSTDDTHSAIGFFNPDTEQYEPIVDDGDVSWPLGDARLNFSREYYITGEAQRNYKGELVIAFTDKDKYPKYLNCDNPSLASIDDFRLFPYFTPPTIKAEQTIGGRLDPGSYYVAVGYERNDGTSTSYSAIGSLVTITPSAIEGLSDKALEVTITQADTSYDNLRVAVISKVSGITKAIELLDLIPISDGTINFLFTGDNLSRDIDLSEVLVEPAVYNKVGTIGQLNDALYIGELEVELDLNDMQIFANDVRIEWVSELINAVSAPAEHINGSKKSMMHEEVYAVYIRYRKTRGGSTKWFTVPGNIPLSVPNSAEATTGGETATVPAFKVEDTIPYFNGTTFSGGTGIWTNTNEKYPNTPDFGTRADQPVRHHKMPSIRWCKANLYAANDDYGKSSLDLLGLKAMNVRIPDKYKDLISGYELGYAKRSIGNMTVYGQSLLLHGCSGNGATVNSPIYTTGGNFVSDIIHGDIDTTDPRQLRTLRKDSFRFHGFDVLFNKPSIQPSFISAQLRLRKGNIRAEGYIENGMHDNVELPIINLIDYTIGDAPRQISIGQKLRKVTESFYLTNGVNAYNFINSRHENVFAGRLVPGTAWPINVPLSGFRANGGDTEVSHSLDEEESYLINLIAVKDDLYTSVFSQPMVSAGSAKSLTDVTPFWGGDTFICPYTFHTYGRHETNDTHGDGFKGKKMVRRFICESISNIHLRYEIPGNDYSKWYPRNTLTPSPQQNYFVYLDRSKDPNQFGYSKDFNALNDLVTSIIYNPFREELTKFPFRIHRGGKNTRQNKARSWRTFLPLDYYECQKNMGRIVHIEGMDDHLLIHCENALFLTQDKATLQGGSIDVILGSGDIFQFEPQPAIGAKLGYGGTQHDLACVQTPVGYAFVDAKLGEVYLFKGQLKNLNPGLNNFFRDVLKVTGTNVFNGNGITIGWDQKYKRILLTVKNKRIISSASNGPVKWIYNPFFWRRLQVGDHIYRDGKYLEYIGPNDGTYDCPADPLPPVITWEPAEPYCLQVNGQNTGVKAWAKRRRLEDGVETFIGDNTEIINIMVPYGPYFPPVADTDACPLPAPTITWEGRDPDCQTDSSITCSVGTLSTINGQQKCVETQAPTEYCLNTSVQRAYAQYGTRIYKPGFHGSSIGLLDAPTTETYPLLTMAHVWKNTNDDQTDGPENPISVWVADCTTGVISAPAIGTVVTAKLDYNNTGAARMVYVGVMGDNEFTLKVNGATIAQTDGTSNTNNFRIFHIFPVTLQPNANEFFVIGVGGGGVADAVGMIVYDVQDPQVLIAGEPDTFHVVASTADLKYNVIAGGIAAYACPAGWELVNTNGTYSCQRISDPVTRTGSGNNGMVLYATRCRRANGIPDGFCEPNTNGGGTGPYLPPSQNLGLCPLPVVGIQCGANVNQNYAGNDVHIYEEQPIGIAAGKVVTLRWDSYDRPNRFNIKKDGNIVLTTGWRGVADYQGPWGNTLAQTQESGILTFLIEAGHTYSVLVEAGPANPNNPQSDNYNYNLICS